MMPILTPAGSLADAPRGSQGDAPSPPPMRELLQQMEADLRALHLPSPVEQLLAAAQARVVELEAVLAWMVTQRRVDVFAPRAGEVHLWMYGSNRVRPDRCVVTPSLEECVERAKAMGIQEGR